VKRRSILFMRNGAVRSGTLEIEEHSSGAGGQVHFEPDNETRVETIDLASVALISVGDTGVELQNAPRFFDTALVPSFLWVRAALIDGQIIEGMISNSWDVLNRALLELNIPSPDSESRQVLIPRSSIAQFQVITIR
jgi:hypothetical protein